MEEPDLLFDDRINESIMNISPNFNDFYQDSRINYLYDNNNDNNNNNNNFMETSSDTKSDEELLDFFYSLEGNRDAIVETLLNDPYYFCSSINAPNSTVLSLFKVNKNFKCLCSKELDTECINCEILKVLKPGKIGQPYVVSCPLPKIEPKYEQNTINDILQYQQNPMNDIQDYEQNAMEDLLQHEEFVFKKSLAKKIKCELLTPTNVKETTSCGLINYQGCVLLGTTEFMNETLVGFLLKYVFENAKANKLFDATTIVDNYGAIMCHSSNINVMEFVNSGDLTQFFEMFPKYYPTVNPQLSVLAVFQILTQISGTLYFLQKYYDFTHGDLKLANVFVSSHPVLFRYFNGRRLAFDFVVKIADYGKSAITVPLNNLITLIETQQKITHVRVFNNDHPFFSTVLSGQPQAERDVQTGVLYYTLPFPAVDLNIYLHWRHMGVPFFKTFDTYVFMASLMMNKIFNYIMRSDVYLMQTWELLWFPSELEKVEKRLADFIKNKSDKQREGTGICIQFLAGFKMRCDATEIIWNRMINSNLYKKK